MAVMIEPISRDFKQMPTLFCIYDLYAILGGAVINADTIRAFRENILLYIGWWAAVAGLTEGYTVLSLVVTESQLRDYHDARSGIRRLFGVYNAWTHSWTNPNSDHICRLLAFRVNLAEALAEFQRTQEGRRTLIANDAHIPLRAITYPAIFKPDEVTYTNQMTMDSWNVLPNIRPPTHLNGLEPYCAFSRTPNARQISAATALRLGNFPRQYTRGGPIGRFVGYPFCCGMNIGHRKPFPRLIPLIMTPASTSEDDTATITLYPLKPCGATTAPRAANVKIQTVDWRPAS